MCVKYTYILIYIYFIYTYILYTLYIYIYKYFFSFYKSFLTTRNLKPHELCVAEMCNCLQSLMPHIDTEHDSRHTHTHTHTHTHMCGKSAV